MNLLKTSFYASISQTLSIVAGLITMKVVSSKIGPEGLAMTGQYLNTTSLLTIFATGAIGTGVIKYLAQYGEDRDKQLNVIRTAGWITLICTIIISLIVVLSSAFLSRQAFKTDSYYLVYILWGIFLFFTSFSALFSNILNGLKLIPYLTIVNVCGTIGGLFFTIYLAIIYGVFGVLIAANFTSMLLFTIHIYFLNKYRWFSIRALFQRIDKSILKLLIGFIMMSLVSGFLVPFIQLLVRDRIITTFSFEQAGYWQSLTRISDYYLGFITAVISVYYLPRLSELKHNQEIKAEIWKMYKIIMPIVIGMSLCIWLCRYIIIRTVLTEKFLPSASLYGVQFMGDVFKIASWLLAYILLAKALTSAFIITEIVFSCSYVIFCFFFMDRFGLIGAVYGFFINYLLLWILMLFMMRRYLK